MGDQSGCWRDIALGEGAVAFNVLLCIDPGGIAKGFAVDQLFGLFDGLFDGVFLSLLTVSMVADALTKMEMLSDRHEFVIAYYGRRLLL